MLTVKCGCGAVVPYRYVPDYYRLTPNAVKIRRDLGWGVQFSLLKQFMDTAEATTRSGQTILRFPSPITLSRNEARYRDIVKRCQRIGYLEYVCRQCERTLTYQRRRYPHQEAR